MFVVLRNFATALLLLTLSWALGLGSTAAAKSQLAHAPALSGELRLLTYNIAGLPEGISRSRPRANMPVIAPLLADYDIALIQEDFAYQALLRSGVRQRYHSTPHLVRIGFDFGDGLSRFSHAPFSEPRRYTWTQCNGYLDSGSDCLAPKGFSFARHELANGVELDVYNVHFDAGWSPKDSDVRRAQVTQLVLGINERSRGRAVVVAGDTNMFGHDLALLGRLEKGAELRDSCRVLACSQPRRIDRVLFRSSKSLTLQPESWSIDARFVDTDGQPLSDHLPVAVTFTWNAHVGQASVP